MAPNLNHLISINQVCSKGAPYKLQKTLLSFKHSGGFRNFLGMGQGQRPNTFLTIPHLGSLELPNGLQNNLVDLCKDIS